MKLKNFIKKSKKKVKKVKTFHTTIKQDKKQTRADNKLQLKSNKKIILLTILSALIFLVVVVLFLIGFFYKNYLLKEISTKKIIIPGAQNVVEVDKARQILVGFNIKIKSFGYSTSSAALTLKIESGPVVYFSEAVEFLKQAEVLEKILYSLKSEDGSARVIDLRYNRPIVKF